MGRLRVVLLAAVVLAVAGGAFAWMHFRDQARSRAGASAGPRAVPVVAATATVKDVPFYFDGIGTVQAYNTVTVHSRVDGQLMEVDFNEGQDVKKGDVLARLDPRTYQAALELAVATQARDQAQLADARLDLQRYINLGNRVTGQQIDTQRALVAQLEATVKADAASIDSARTMLSYTTIASPIDGRTGIRQVDVGNIVHAADTNGLVVITQLQPISAIFTLPQQDLVPINQAIAAGQASRDPLTVDAMTSDGTTRLDRGSLTLVDNEINQSTGTITLKASFPNPRYLLWPGGFVDVRLLVRMERDRTTVPAVAIQHGPDGAYVFAIDEDSKSRITPVTVEFVEGDDAVIAKGLSPGQRLVVDGMSRLDDGTLVRASAPAAGAAPASAGAPPIVPGQGRPGAPRRRPPGEGGAGGERQGQPGGQPAPAGGQPQGGGG